MNDTNKDISTDEWQQIVKSIPVVHDIAETTAEGVIRQVLKAVFEKNGLSMDKLDDVVSNVIEHSKGDVGFFTMHGLAIPHGYIPEAEKLLVGVGILRQGLSIDFNAIDGSRTHIFFVIVCSSPNDPEYRKFLARLCGCIISDDKVPRIASIATRDDLEALLDSN